MKTTRLVALAGTLLSLLVLGCGGSDTTTVIEREVVREPSPEKQPAETEGATEPSPDADELRDTSDPLAPTSPISTEGVGPLLIGMTKTEAERAARVEIKYLPGAVGTCRFAEPQNDLDMGLMFYNGELARIDIRDPRLETLSGIGVGASEEDVLDAYGNQIEIEEHFYEATGNYMTYLPSDRSNPTRVIFDTKNGIVNYIRAGKLPEVEFVEGCA